MTPEFATTQLDSQPILGIRTTIPMHEIGKVMGPLFGRCTDTSSRAARLRPECPSRSTTRYPARPSTSNARCPLPCPSPARAGSRPAELPAGTAATVTHMGPYDDLRTYVGGADGVDEVAGPRRRGSTLGGLRHRPRRRARPVEVAHGYLLPGSLITHRHLSRRSRSAAVDQWRGGLRARPGSDPSRSFSRSGATLSGISRVAAPRASHILRRGGRAEAAAIGTIDSSVHLASVPNLYDQHAQRVVLDAGNDATISGPVFPELAERGALECLPDAVRVVQLGHATMQEGKNPPPRLRVELVQVAPRRPGQARSSTPWRFITSSSGRA